MNNKTYIVANWKMNPENSKVAVDLAETIKKEVGSIQNAQVVLCPPFVFMPQLLAAENVYIGAQNCFWEEQGAFTGEISPQMLKGLGCSYVILGHSERKNYLGESFEMINKKLKTALEAGLTPIVCIGEKEHGDNKGELEDQIREVLKNVTPEQAQKLILTYEPEWAISSNKNAKPAHPKDCGESIMFMKEVAKEMFGDTEIPILYGGSTNSENIQGFMQAGASGALVGSASLKAEEFTELVKNAAIQ